MEAGSPTRLAIVSGGVPERRGCGPGGCGGPGGAQVANEALPEDRQVRFRIGVHVGDVMVKGGDLFGDGVNIAARLQALAEPGGVCISGDAHRHVRKTLPLVFIDLGPQQVKNIAEPVSAFASMPVALGSELQ